MATSLFEIPEWLDYANFDNYPSEENPTTNADFINYARNQNKLVGALTGALLWQPNINFIEGKIIISPNMPEGMEAVALTGGVTGTAEPAWESGTEEYQDSGVKWKLRYKHWSKSVEEIADLTTGATNRLPNKAYTVGNVVYADSNLSVALKCTTAGTTSNTELDISGRAVGESVEDGTVTWEVVSRVSDGMPVGFKYFDFVTEIPVGSVGALGVLYNRELYADLWKAAQENKQVITEAEWQALAQANDGNVPWYSDGDGSTTFRVPALKCWVKGASGIEEVGNYLEAGLPNIKAQSLVRACEHDNTLFSDYATNGAFNVTERNTAFAIGLQQDITGPTGQVLKFDASKSNSIYGNSTTVQPPSLIGIWLIKAFGTVTNIGNADVANVMQAVEQVQTQLGERNIKTFTSLEQIGLNNTTTEVDVFNTMPSNSELQIQFYYQDFPNFELSKYNCDGLLIFKRSNESVRSSIMFQPTNEERIIFGSMFVNKIVYHQHRPQGSLPSLNVIQIAVSDGSSQVKYVAPSDGWVRVIGVTNGVYASLGLHNLSTGFDVATPGARNNVRIGLVVPVAKDNVVSVNIESMTGVVAHFHTCKDDE